MQLKCVCVGGGGGGGAWNNEDFLSAFEMKQILSL